METTKITTAEVQTIISNITDGHFFSCSFIKKNGEVREINCRKGVKKFLVENARPKASNPSNLVTVYDVKNEGYRNFDINRVLSIKAEKFNFVVER